MTIIDLVEKQIIEGQLTNAELVQLIELCGSYLNLQTIPQYCKTHDITYNGAKKCRNVIGIFGVKFIIDNE